MQVWCLLFAAESDVEDEAVFKWENLKYFHRVLLVKVVRLRKGLCGVIFRKKGTRTPGLAYIPEGVEDVVIFGGNALDLRKGVPLGYDLVYEESRLSREELKELDSIVDFEEGKKDAPVVYLIVDPDCPYCRALEKSLLPHVKKGELRVKVVLLPLQAIHPSAEEDSRKVLCVGTDRLQALAEHKLPPKANCPAVRKLEDNQKTLEKLSLAGATPSLIFEDGTYMEGMMPAEQVVELARQVRKGQKAGASAE